jgi:hypothetical protein
MVFRRNGVPGNTEKESIFYRENMGGGGGGGNWQIGFFAVVNQNGQKIFKKTGPP